MVVVDPKCEVSTLVPGDAKLTGFASKILHKIPDNRFLRVPVMVTNARTLTKNEKGKRPRHTAESRRCSSNMTLLLITFAFLSSIGGWEDGPCFTTFQGSDINRTLLCRISVDKRERKNKNLLWEVADSGGSCRMADRYNRPQQKFSESSFAKGTNRDSS